MGRFSMVILILWAMSWAAQASNAPAGSTHKTLGENFTQVKSLVGVMGGPLSQLGVAVDFNKQLSQATTQLTYPPSLNIVQGAVVTDPAPMIYSKDYSSIKPVFQTPYYDSQAGGLNRAVWDQMYPLPPI